MFALTRIIERAALDFKTYSIVKVQPRDLSAEKFTAR